MPRLRTATKEPISLDETVLLISTNFQFKCWSLVWRSWKFSSWHSTWNFIHKQIYTRKIPQRKIGGTIVFNAGTHSKTQSGSGHASSHEWRELERNTRGDHPHGTTTVVPQHTRMSVTVDKSATVLFQLELRLLGPIFTMLFVTSAIIQSTETYLFRLLIYNLSSNNLSSNPQRLPKHMQLGQLTAPSTIIFSLDAIEKSPGATSENKTDSTIAAVYCKKKGSREDQPERHGEVHSLNSQNTDADSREKIICQTTTLSTNRSYVNVGTHPFIIMWDGDPERISVVKHRIELTAEAIPVHLEPYQAGIWISKFQCIEVASILHQESIEWATI